MNTRRLSCSLVLVALVLGSVSAGWAGPAKPPEKPEKPEFTIIRLEHLQAEEAKEVLTKLLGLESAKGPTRIVADPRTNSLLISATAADRLTIEAVVTRLETAAQEPGRKELVTRVYPLRHVPADKELLANLQVILPPDGRIAADPRTNAVILHADLATHEAVAKLLETLDRPIGPPSADWAVQVRIVWLVSGKAPEGSDPPADLADVMAKLEKLGVKDPKMLAQFVVPAAPDGKFSIKGVTKRDKAWSLSAQGELASKDDRISLSIQLQAGVAEGGASARSLCELEPTIIYTLGQTALLGVTPTEELTSIFAVQLIPEAPKAKGRR